MTTTTTAHHTSTACVLVAGAAAVGKATLLHSLQAVPCGAHASQTGLYELRLDTKYYTADLVVQCVDLPSSTASPAQSDQLQALVLVVDAESRSSYQAALSFHKSLDEREFDIQLLVANKLDKFLVQQPPPQQQDNGGSTAAALARQRPAWLEDARTWCYSNGFEYIEAAAGNSSVDATLQDDGEKQGVARVAAALQAHLWPDIVPKGRQQQQQVNTAQHDDAADGNKCSSSCISGPTPSGGTTSSSTSTSTSSTKDQGATDRLEKQQQQHPQQPNSRSSLDAAPHPKHHPSSSTNSKAEATGSAADAANKPAAAAAADSDDDGACFLEDTDMDDFEALMRQVMGESGLVLVRCFSCSHRVAML